MMHNHTRPALLIACLICAVLIFGCGGGDGPDPIRPTGTVEGTVTAVGSGAPVQGATVTVEEEAGVTTAALQGITDETGNYQINDVPSGVQVFACSNVGYLTTRKAISIGAGIVNEINFELAPAP